MNTTSTSKTLSILIPALNEEESLPNAARAVTAIAERYQSELNFEFIILDNASIDGTYMIAKKLCASDERFKLVRMSRTFDLDYSLMAGYSYASGDAIVVLYSDLQDPPEVIHDFISKWREGFDVVYGVRTERPGDPKWRNALVRLTYIVINKMSDYPIPVNTGDFRLISRRVRDAVLQCQETNRYTRGLVSWVGFKQIGIPYKRQPRAHGHSRVNLFGLITFTLSAITSFSMRPLQVFTAFGFCILAVSFLMAPFYFGGYLFGITPKGVTTVIFLLLIVIGFQSLGIGVLGEYLGRTYMEVKRRPPFIIDHTVNIDTKK